jgi:hypothetical protein
MFEYQKEQDLVLRKVWLDYLGGRYSGRGILRWKPGDGFHLDAFMSRQGAPESSSIELGRTRVIPRSQFTTIRMIPLSHDWAIAPGVALVDQFDLLMEKRLSIELERVIFFDSLSHPLSPSHFESTAVYHIARHLSFPDVVDTEIRINNERVAGSLQRGLSYTDDKGRAVVGRLLDEDRLQLNWRFPKSLYKRDEFWRSSEAVRVAFSILSGQIIGMPVREAERDRQMIVEVQKTEDAKFLGLYRLFDEEELNKETLIRLVDFLARNDRLARICRAIFERIAEATRQRTFYGHEFLIATTLDAALRTLDGARFRADESGTWKVVENIEQFRVRFLSDKWLNVRNAVLQARKRLRHRNAHPNWLEEDGGDLSQEELEKSLDDRILLTRFYGYMILALAGVRDIEPIFPRPHREWGPLMVRQRIEPTSPAATRADSEPGPS